jgi:hypothetical protein
MSPEAIPFGHDSPERGTAPFPSPMCRSTNTSVTSGHPTRMATLRSQRRRRVHELQRPSIRNLCISALILDFQLSTVNSAHSAQLTCFDNLSYSFTTTQESPLCFHNLTNSSVCNRFICTYLSKYPGYTPLPAATSEPILEVSILTQAASMACMRSGKGRHPGHREGSAFPCVAAQPQTALTNPAAPAYNASSLMTNRGTEFILGPPSRWRAAPFLNSGWKQ